MHTYVRLIVALSLGTLLWAAPPAAAYEMPADLTIRMELYGLDGGPLKYKGERVSATVDGHVRVDTRFTTPAGDVVQTTTTVFDKETLALVSYRREDQRTGLVHAMERDGDVVRFKTRESADAPYETDEIAWQPDMVYSQTIARYAFRHLDALSAGETLAFELIAAGRHSAYTFRMRRDRDAEAKTPELLWMRMEPDSWFIRQLVDPMYFLWEPGNPPRLREFRGRSSILTDAGKEQSLRYVYHYDGYDGG